MCVRCYIVVAAARTHGCGGAIVLAVVCWVALPHTCQCAHSSSRPVRLSVSRRSRASALAPAKHVRRAVCMARTLNCNAPSGCAPSITCSVESARRLARIVCGAPDKWGEGCAASAVSGITAHRVCPPRGRAASRRMCRRHRRRCATPPLGELGRLRPTGAKSQCGKRSSLMAEKQPHGG